MQEALAFAQKSPYWRQHIWAPHGRGGKSVTVGSSDASSTTARRMRRRGRGAGCEAASLVSLPPRAAEAVYHFLAAPAWGALGVVHT